MEYKQTITVKNTLIFVFSATCFGSTNNHHALLYKNSKVCKYFWGVSSLLCVEKTNGEVNISHETTTMVVVVVS